MDKVDEALVSARQALEMAHKAVAMSDQTSRAMEVLGSFAKSVSDDVKSFREDFRTLRSENSTQHAEGRAIMSEGFEKVHARISTVATKQQTNKEELIERIDAGDKKIRDEDAVRREKIMKIAILILVAITLGLIGKVTGISIQLPV